MTQPEGITRPIMRKPRLLYQSDIRIENEKVHDDGGEGFEKKEMEGFQIRRPRRDPEFIRQRKEHNSHKLKGCKIEGHRDEIRVIDKEDSSNSYFCTPSSQPTCSPDKHPLITTRISKHIDSNNCISLMRTFETRHRRQQREYGHGNPDEGKVKYDEHRTERPNIERASAHTRLAYAKRIVEPEVVQEEEEEQEEEENGNETFEALTLAESMLISGSLESITNYSQTYGEQRTEYRRIVEKLMKNTGILCKDDMDELQRKLLKKKVLSDFRRQVNPRPEEYNAGGTMEGHGV
jgi:hypothetical protein